jgi:peroxiredoxin
MKNIRPLFTSRNLYYVLLHVVLITLAIQVVILSRQNRQMNQRKSLSVKEQLKEGDTLDLHQAHAIRGGDHMDTTSSRQLVFVLSTSCPFCRESVPAWKELASKAKSPLAVFGISVDSCDSTSEYMKRNNITFPVYICLDAAAFKKANKINGVPQTILRERGGKVDKVWVGRLDKERLKEVESYTFFDNTNNIH